MVWVCMGHVVQNHSLGEIPAEDAEILDVVTKNTNAIFLIQTMSTKTKPDAIAKSVLLLLTIKPLLQQG